MNKIPVLIEINATVDSIEEVKGMCKDLYDELYGIDDIDSIDVIEKETGKQIIKYEF